MDNDSSNKTVESTTQAPKPDNKQVDQPAGGLAVAAMVVGIVAVVLCWIPFLGLGLGVTAIVLGSIAIKKAQKRSMSTAGLLTGVFATLVNLVFVLFVVIGFAVFGGAATVFGGAVNEAIKEGKVQDSAQKDFNKGETARFDQFDVKVNSVKRDYIPEGEYAKADEGKEFILVNLTVTNKGERESFSNGDLDLSANGVIDTGIFMAVIDKPFIGGIMKKDLSITGNVVYEVPKGSTDLKLIYDSNRFNYTSDSGLKSYRYTLKI